MRLALECAECNAVLDTIETADQHLRDSPGCGRAQGAFYIFEVD